jgi:hypothetical protein
MIAGREPHPSNLSYPWHTASFSCTAVYTNIKVINKMKGNSENQPTIHRKNCARLGHFMSPTSLMQDLKSLNFFVFQ